MRFEGGRGQDRSETLTLLDYAGHHHTPESGPAEAGGLESVLDFEHSGEPKPGGYFQKIKKGPCRILKLKHFLAKSCIKINFIVSNHYDLCKKNEENSGTKIVIVNCCAQKA